MSEKSSPLAAAPAIRCPVFLVHGVNDDLTPPERSRCIYAALTCDHDDLIGESAWDRIEALVRKVIAPTPLEAK